MSEEELEFIKHCGEHFEVLTGGRGHSKTKQIIEQLQQENKQLKEVIEELYEALDYIDDDIMETCENYDVNGIEIKKILNKAKEVIKDE